MLKILEIFEQTNYLKSTKLFLLIALDIFLISVVITYFLPLIENKRDYSDFTVFYSAAKILKEDKKNLYNIDKQKQIEKDLFSQIAKKDMQFVYGPFINPPIFVIPYLPLTYINFKISYYFAMSFLSVLLFIDLLLLSNIFKSKIKRYRIFLLAFSFISVFITLYETQSSFLTLLIFILFFLLVKKKKLFAAGILASSTLYKPQIAFFLTIYILVFGENSKRLGLILGSLIMIFLNLILLGFNPRPYLEINYWYITAFDVLKNQTSTMTTWQGFFAHLHFWFSSISIQESSLVLSAITMAVTFFVIHSIKNKLRFLDLIFCLLIVATLLSGMHFHYHDATLLLFPLFWGYSKFNNFKISILVAIGWVIFLIYSSKPTLPKSPFFHPALFLVLIFILLIKEIKKSKNGNILKK